MRCDATVSFNTVNVGIVERQSADAQLPSLRATRRGSYVHVQRATGNGQRTFGPKGGIERKKVERVAGKLKAKSWKKGKKGKKWKRVDSVGRKCRCTPHPIAVGTRTTRTSDGASVVEWRVARVSRVASAGVRGKGRQGKARQGRWLYCLAINTRPVLEAKAKAKAKV